jgi:hypothetical protein
VPVEAFIEEELHWTPRTQSAIPKTKQLSTTAADLHCIEPLGKADTDADEPGLVDTSETYQIHWGGNTAKGQKKKSRKRHLAAAVHHRTASSDGLGGRALPELP